jgi:GAF domain-containing protein
VVLLSPVSEISVFPSGFSLLSIESTNGNGEAIAKLVRLAAESAKADSASLYSVDAAEGVLKPAVILGLPESYVRGCGDVRIGDQCCGRAVAAKHPWIVSDMLTDPLFASAQRASSVSGIRAAFSVPVIDATGQCIASLACHYRETFTPSNYDLERNTLYATLIAAAVTSRRLRRNQLAS